MANEIYINDSTPLIRVSDKSYPMYFPEVRAEFPNTGFPIPIRIDILEPFGYAPVMSTEKPEGDVVTNGVPELREDGFWYETWVARDYTEDEAKEILDGKKYFSNFNAQEVLRADRELGVDYTFKDTKHKISLQEATLNALYAVKYHIETTTPETVKFMTIEGRFIEFTVEEFSSFYNFLMEAYYNLINTYWSYLDKINSVINLKEYPEEPVSFLP